MLVWWDPPIRIPCLSVTVASTLQVNFAAENLYSDRLPS
jgi:hypothetical protein